MSRMDTRAIKNAVTKPVTKGMLKIDSSGICDLYTSYTVAENIVGTAKINVNEVTALRGKRAKSPVTIIAAERDTPGTSAMI